MKNKKWIALAAAVVLAVTALPVTVFAKKKDSSDDKLVKITLNEVAHSIFYAPQYVAIENGYFKDEGLDLTLVTGFGADKTMTAVISGEADIGFMGAEASIYAYQEGATDPVVNFAQLTQRAGNFLVAREEMPDFKWEDLKGKKVLGGRKGGMPEMVFEYILKQNGLDPQKDLSIDQSIDFGATAAAFTGDNSSDFTVEFEPSATALEKQGAGFVVASLGVDSGYVPYTSYSAKTSYMEKNPDMPVIQMDTVKGCREQGKRLLTLHFCNTNMMLMFLMRDGKADTVVEQFDMLTGLLGLEEFHKIFPVILTDNGSEFKHTRELETTDDGKKRTKVFYCDPQASWQKPQIEKNHEFIRYVLPKGKTLNPYTQEDIIVLMNNINSIRRESLGNKSPYEATADKSILRLMELMGLHLIPADEIRLTSDLLKR